jgi:hypothetical protein
MPDRRPAVLHEHDGQNARHAIPLRPQRRQPVYLVVGDGNRFPDPIGLRSRLAFETFSQHREGRIGGLTTSRLAADAVNHDEQATYQVNVKAILVDFPVKTGIALSRRPDRTDDLHDSDNYSRVWNAAQT